jgi:integrase
MWTDHGTGSQTPHHLQRFPHSEGKEAPTLRSGASPLERVSVLLGHTTIWITERHYAPWVRARQEQAEADVRRALGQDPVALLEAKGMPKVHEKRAVVN